MFRLLAAQKSMYYFEKIKPNTTTYHHTIAMTIKGELNQDQFTHALAELTKRHEVMRSKVTEMNDDIYLQPIPYQDQQFAQAFKVINAKNNDRAKSLDLADTIKHLHEGYFINEPFDFKTGPLWRCKLIKVSDKEYKLYFVFHHLIVDIWSQNIILSDLSEIYNALIEKRQPELPEINSLSTLSASSESNSNQNKLQYWKEKLENLTTLTIQGDRFPTEAFHFQGDRIYFQIDSKTIQSFRSVADKYNQSLSCFLLSSLYALLYRYTAETDICLGVVSANRRGYEQDIDNIVNCFVNSVPIRIDVHKDAPFIELLFKVSKELKNALHNQLALDEVIQKALTSETKASTHVASPFNILCNFNKEKNSLNLKGTQASLPIELNLGHTKFENFGINFDMLPDDSCQGFIEFNTNRFKRRTLEYFLEHLQIFWKNLCEDPSISISQIPLLTENEKRHLTEYHNNFKHTPTYVFLQTLFSNIASLHKKQTAIVFHGEKNTQETITYEQLENDTNTLASYLQNLGVQPEVTVGVSVTRSINLVVAILAILKAGGTVVPLETNLNTSPSNNSTLYHKLSDALIDIVIVDDQTNHLFADFKKNTKSLFTLNIQDTSYIKQVKALRLQYYQPKLSPNNLAYIIYTSGTTGIPKGVMIEHSGLTNLAYSIFDRKLKVGSKILCTAPPTFDCFFFEMLEWISTRGELHLINEKERLKPAVQESVIRDFEINCATLLPDIIKNLNPATLPSLYDVISMGAIPAKDTLDLWYDLGKQIRNEFGPSEATVCTTQNPYIKGKSYTNIGKPIRNVGVFILDKNFKECPIGVPGDLYISGAGLARGYVGKQTLTKEKFVTLYYDTKEYAFYKEGLKKIATAKPSRLDGDRLPAKKRKIEISTAIPMRLYATGDLARYVQEHDESISIEFLGRTDRQIKIHGVRIEIDGIEFLLQKHPLIKDVYVKATPSKDGLIAYVVTKGNNTISKMSIDSYLGQTSIPMAAWPKAVIQIPEMPITKNGKIDTKSLPKPPQINQAVAIPSTPLQTQLCQIWAEVLGNNEIDMNKTFRELGGDSLSFAILESKLNQRLSFTQKTGFNLFNRDITILQLEEMLKPYLQSKLPNSSPKSWSLASGIITLFYPNAKSLALRPLHQQLVRHENSRRSFTRYKI